MKHFYIPLSRRLCLIVMGLALMCSYANAQSVTIGATTGTLNDYYYGPLYRSSAASSFNYSRYGYLYTSAELGIPSGATITQIEWLRYDSDNLTGSNNTFDILLKNSSSATLTSGSQWGALTSGATTVYSSTTQNFTATAGTWESYTLTTPFSYTGGALEIYTNHAKFGTASGSLSFYINSATGKSIGYAGSGAPTATTNLTSSYGGYRPTIRITYTLSPCVDPPTPGVAVTTASPVCANSSFTLSLSGTSFGSGQTYQWESSPDNLTWTAITGATSFNYTTTQTVPTYYRAQITCGLTTVASGSVFVDMNSFLNCYCTSNATQTSYSDIGNVTFGSLNNGNPTPVLSNSTANNTYSNFTSLTPQTYFQTNTYPISVAHISASASFYNVYVNVYIDYDHDGTFNTTSERVLFGPITSASNPVISGNVTIPATALTGITQMRVVMVETSSINQPCGTYTWGETEDYYIDIQPLPPIDAGVTARTSPANGPCFSSAETISVEVKNYGGNQIDFSLNPLTINASMSGPNPATFAPVTVTTGQLAVGATQTVVVTSGYNMSAPGSYVLSASASVTGDGWAPNDAMPNDTIIVNNPGMSTSGPSVVCEFDSAAIAVTATPNGFGPVDTLYNTTPMLIPDANPLGDTSSIVIPNGPANASSVIAVHIDSILHTFTSHLSIYLVAPNGSFIDLSSGNGGSGNDYRNTTFIESSNNLITSGAAPFSNNYQPEQSFANLTGTGAGTWSLRINDGIQGDIGTLYGWSITLPLGNNIVTYSWSPVAGLSSASIAAPMAAPSATTTYYVTATDINGCINTDSIQIAVNPAPAVSLGADVGICQGNTATLDPGPGYITYMWQDSTTNQTITVDSTGTYVVEVMDGNTCRNRDTINVTVFNPQVNLGADTTICQNSPLVLDAGTGFASYAWSTSATTQQITVTSANTYIVGVADPNGCVTADTITVSVNPLPSLNLGADGAVCAGTVLDAGAGYTYLWQDNTMNQTYTPTASGTYYVDITDNNGCVNSDTINLVLNPTPAVNLGPDVVQCGSPVVLDAGNPGNTYMWSNNDMSQVSNVNASGTYYVDVTNSFGCIGSDTIMVTINSLPVAFAGNDTTICAESTVTLNAAPGFAAYQWQEVSFQSNTQSVTVSPGVTTTYSLTVTDATGCTSAPDMVTVTVEPLPNANFSFTQSGMTVNFSNNSVGNQNASYMWNFGDMSTSTQTSPTHTYAANGYYTVTLIVTTDCGSDTTTRLVGMGVSVEEVEGIGSLVVYPNPSEGNFNISIKDAKYNELTIEVLDIQGKVVYSERDTNVSPEYLKSLNLSGIAKGMYYLRLNSGKQVTTQKLIIQ